MYLKKKNICSVCVNNFESNNSIKKVSLLYVDLGSPLLLMCIEAYNNYHSTTQLY